MMLSGSRRAADLTSEELGSIAASVMSSDEARNEATRLILKRHTTPTEKFLSKYYGRQLDIESIASESIQEAIVFCGMNCVGSFQRLVMRIACRKAGKERKQSARLLMGSEGEAAMEIAELDRIELEELDRQDEIMRMEKFALLKQALRSLPIIDRDIFLRRFALQQSHAKIAGFYGISSNAVECRLRQIKKRLRSLLNLSA